jgi:FMN phosphatase YigB (HAD superfamily)
MPKTLLEYAQSLDDRKLIWPAPPKRIPVDVTPDIEPLADVRGIAFCIYGTLLRISQGALVVEHPLDMRMEIALEKTIKEFNMWTSMTRQPGAPSKQMYARYTRVIDEYKMGKVFGIGDQAELDAAALWAKLIRMLQQKDYSYDESSYGTLEQYAEKVAFFFHSCLQGIEAEEEACETLQILYRAKPLGLLDNAQRFTAVQMLRAFRRQGTLRSLDEVFDPALITFSYREGMRKPSKSLFRRAVERFRKKGIAAGQVLYVGTRLRDDLAIAKEVGMRTAILAADQTAVAATPEELADPELRPDRVLVRLSQVLDVIGR